MDLQELAWPKLRTVKLKHLMAALGDLEGFFSEWSQSLITSLV